jgi:hypothetical protein
VKILKRNILSFMGVSPVRSLICGNIEGIGPEARRKWLAKIEKLGRRAA